MLPLLKFASDRKEHSVGEAEEFLGREFNLTREELETLLPSGRAFVFSNRVGWARTYLKKADLLNYPRRGFLQITSRGLEVINKNPSRIDNNFLKQFPEFVEFIQAHRDDKEGLESLALKTEQTPEEALEFGYQKLHQNLTEDLLIKIKEMPPRFFERLVVDVLIKMGYGGSLEDAGKVIGQSGDGGIDGIINEDKLGLDVIYVQAKRWEGVVGRPEIMKFVGALQGKRARKGVFITTSTFTTEARHYAQNLDAKIVLIDGYELASLMIEMGVGVSDIAVYNVKKIDSDYFVE